MPPLVKLHMRSNTVIWSIVLKHSTATLPLARV